MFRPGAGIRRVMLIQADDAHLDRISVLGLRFQGRRRLGDGLDDSRCHGEKVGFHGHDEPLLTVELENLADGRTLRKGVIP